MLDTTDRIENFFMQKFVNMSQKTIFVSEQVVFVKKIVMFFLLCLNILGEL